MIEQLAATAANKLLKDLKMGERKSNNEQAAISQRVWKSSNPQWVVFDCGIDSVKHTA